MDSAFSALFPGNPLFLLSTQEEGNETPVAQFDEINMTYSGRRSFSYLSQKSAIITVRNIASLRAAPPN